ncbi:MAG: RNA polymerase sigma-54 factor [Candidatus Rokubacteria bacterium 13_1_40CM_4_69_39]|jgi:RNA polymerase sigma-54 factor|nr:MAG: RNA polymerase sigma-54 factor [Candidatus Rokubacteria bacterium 13_1_40CM_4_69_39]OLC90664.1 MAG: RNA polymerase sigma-54 factor [Candidatus Rokubacteria bacterium 13_1_40CM_3_69_38]
MAMEARLSLRQSQRVVMTPLLQQAIQLLQLSTLELQEVVQKELLENPLLEEMPVDGAETPDAGEATPSAEATPAPTVEPITVDPPPTAERQTDDLPFDPISVMFDEPEERSLVAQEEREDLPFENMVRSVSSLADHLEEQLRFVTEDPAARRIGAEIIGNLDEDGYLRAELEEIAQRCAATPEEVERVLTEMIQKFDPIGVGARTISECLLLQLRSNPPVDPVSVEIVERHFEDLSRRRYADIARALKLSADRIMESVEEIMALEPKPGRRFGGNDSRYIVPDVFVYKLGSDYTVVLNEEGIPRLRVNSLYRSLLRSSGDEARQYVEQKLRSALWLIKSVDQRQRTLRKVTQSIVKFQREFLDKGLPYLRPLSLRDVGEDISMHESTISRVTTNKYVETPQGLFELKFFFHSGIASGDGEMVSSVSVKKMIQDLLGNEDATKPLSDQEVAGILKGRGLTIARRTVAKYREELGILPSHQRRLQPRKR